MTDPSPVPRLDLAPKLNRELRLWWPPDYLRLLYWAFFFPQAIRWYIKEFGDHDYTNMEGLRAVWRALRNDSLQLHLVAQAFISLSVAVVTSVWMLSKVGATYTWTVWVSIIGISVFASMVGAGWGLASCIAATIVGSLMLTIGWGVGSLALVGVDTMRIVFYLVGISAVFGMILSTTFGALGGVAFRVVRGITFTSLYGFIIGLVFIISKMVSHISGGTVAWIDSLLSGIIIGTFFLTGFILVSARIPDWLISWSLTQLSEARIWGSHIAWIPLPSLQQRLRLHLDQDWLIGVSNLNQILAYTTQFIPAIGAANEALTRSSDDQLLGRAALLVEHLSNWDLIRFGSASLENMLWHDGYRVSLWPTRWRELWQTRFPIEPRIDTLARAVCASFWFWHVGEADRAESALATISHLSHGPELHSIAQAIVAGQEVDSLTGLAAWKEAAAWLDALPDPELRPGTLAALRTLRVVSADARTARNATALLNRSTALNRASAALTRLIETGSETCPEPEWPLIRDIAIKWRDIISKAGGVVGDEVLRQPVANPYEGYSGLPVTGASFVGRGDTLAKIETRWAAGDRLPPLILYGHRRMGKSSILRNLARSAPAGTLLVYLNMQDAGWVDHTGELLRDFADAIHRATGAARLDAGPIPIAEDFGSLGAGRQGLNALLDRLDRQMAGRRLILAVDEFEVIQEGIEKGRIDPDLLHYLRAKTSQYGWLALIFAGLHTLDEMGHDYRSAFYGAAEHIRVGYLAHDDAIRLITQPHPDFALEYEPELREELYRLTYGQPYLLQRICWELVNHWNERFLKEGETTPRILMMDELAPVLTPDFYAAAGYYFDGVWDNVTEAERQMMRAMAGRDAGGWTAAELAAATGQSEETVSVSLDLLRRHDVILDEMGGVRFAAELLRRWVARYQAADASVG